MACRHAYGFHPGYIRPFLTLFDKLFSLFFQEYGGLVSTGKNPRPSLFLIRTHPSDEGTETALKRFCTLLEGKPPEPYALIATAHISWFAVFMPVRNRILFIYQS